MSVIDKTMLIYLKDENNKLNEILEISKKYDDNRCYKQLY